MSSRHYVYALIDPRICTPMYVGKGVASRRFHHFKSAPMDARSNPDKVSTFKAIEDAGLKPQAVVLSWHDTQEEAYAAEKAMIEIIGLDNLTNQNAGGAGKLVKEDNRPLTPKQEKFAQCVAKGMTQSDGYRTGYDAENMTDKQIHEEASKLMSIPKVAQRVKEIGRPVVEKLQAELVITKETLVRDLAALQAQAVETDQVGAAINSIKEQGKLLDIYPAERRENKNINVNDLSERISAGRDRLAKLKVVK